MQAQPAAVMEAEESISIEYVKQSAQRLVDAHIDVQVAKKFADLVEKLSFSQLSHEQVKDMLRYRGSKLTSNQLQHLLDFKPIIKEVISHWPEVK